ncbi:MAG: phosphopantetheine-binding protein [Acidobacteriota bacterium]
MPNTSEMLQTILTEKFSVPEDRIRREAKLTDLGLDSLDLIEVLFEVEDTFHIRVPQDSAAIKLATIDELLATITQLVDAAPARREAEAG